MKNIIFKRLAALILTVSFAVLAAPPNTQAPADEHPAVTLFTAKVSDPLYGFNHAMETFNSGCIRHVVHPVSRGYNAIVPECVSTAIANCGNNLMFPLHLINCSLQGKFANAWEETERFAINTTVGILGFRDQATKWGFNKHHEDFGQTFATWGIGTGCYLNLPFAGPTNIRDGIGTILDMPLNIAFWIPGANAVFRTNGMLVKADFLNEYFTTSVDTYPMTRLAATVSREAAICDGATSEVTPDLDDSLGYLRLTLKDKSFARRVSHYSVKLPGADRKLTYAFWQRPDFHGKILFLLPGIGNHYDDSRIAVLAELAYNAGWSVAVISSTFTPDFFLATPNRLPGIVRKDVQALDNALATIQNDILQRNNPRKLHVPQIAVMGFSLGAINTLNLAAIDHNGSATFHAERYIAVNPPRNPIGALQNLDSFFDIPLSWPAETRNQRLHDLTLRIAALLDVDDNSDSTAAVPQITRDESLFLIGLNIRTTLLNIAQAIRTLPPTPAIWPEQQNDDIPRNTRDARALGCSFKNYVKDILLPYAYAANLIDSNQNLEQLANDYKLDALAPDLENNPKVMLFHNQNDPLLSDGDIDWFQKTLGQRAVIFPRGGHLGNLAVPEVQAAIAQALSK